MDSESERFYLKPFQLMEDLLNGRSIRRVARPVVKERKRVPVPAPTLPPQEAERDAGKKHNRPRNVTLESAEVWSISIQFT